MEHYETIDNGHAITWEVHHDPLPLTVEDLAEVNYAHYSTQWKEGNSIFVERFTGTQHSFPDGENAPDLSYEIVEVKAGFLFDLCLKQYRTFRDLEWSYRPLDTAPWQADAVYRKYSYEEPWNQFLICWGKRIVEIQFPYQWDLTAEQIAIVVEKLRG